MDWEGDVTNDTADVSNGVDHTQAMVICRVDGRLCALPIESVIETMRPLPVESVTKAPPFLRGISLIRGEPIPVVDAAVLLGAEETSPTRLVTLRVGDRKVALAVDAVIGIRQISDDALHALPPLFDGDARAAISAIGALDAELMVVMGGARLIPEETWSLLEGGKTK